MRESGPVSKVLEAEGGADHSPAKPYIGQARTFLGTLKNQMALGGLDQGKLTRRLEDGTIIMVTSVMGQDKISITVPTPVPPPPEELEIPPPEIPPEPEWEPEEHEPPLETDRYGVCGYATFFVDGFSTRERRAWVWKPTHGETTEIPGPSGARSWWASAISGDGRVVVGAWISAADGVQRAYKWSSGEGAVDLGSPTPAAFSSSGATGVSENGRVIVGYGPTSEDSALRGCEWVAVGGNSLQVLEGSATAIDSFTPPAVKVSPNGKYIFGGTQQRLQFSRSEYIDNTHFAYFEVSADFARGALWVGTGTAFNGPIPLPLASTTHIYLTPSSTGPYTATISYSIIAGNVANNGTVCGSAPYAARCKLGGGIEFLTPPGITPDPPTDGVHASDSGPDGEQTDAVGITADGGRVAGNLLDISGTYVWTNGVMRDGPTANGKLNDMSRDGTRYCGVSIASVEVGTEALFWDSRGEVVIPRLGGCEEMVATGVASKNVRIPPIPPKPIPLDLV